MRLLRYVALTLLSLVFVTEISAQTAPVYARISFNKVAPGHTLSEAMALQGEWKKVLEAHRNAGFISNWAVFSVYNGLKSPAVDFDYISVAYGSDLDRMQLNSDTVIARLAKTDSSFATLRTRTGQVEQVVRRIVVANEVMIGTSTPSMYFVFEGISATGTQASAYAAFERKTKPLHEARLKAGDIGRWSFWRPVTPWSDDMPATYWVVAGYPSFMAMERWDAFEAGIPSAFNMTPAQFWDTAAGLRRVALSFTARVAHSL